MVNSVLRARLQRRPRVGRRALPAALTAALLCVTAACGSSTPAAPTVTPPSSVYLGTVSGPPGTYLVDGSGRALYLWDADRRGPSTCYDKCAVAWPPVLVAGKATAGPGVDASLIGTSDRKDGTKQVTYDGWPLYHFAPDALPGQLSGEGNTGFGAVWWLVQPNGKPLASEGSNTGASNTGASGTG